MIPIPSIIFNHIVFPLQLLASDFSARALELIGIPVLREGNVIQLARIVSGSRRSVQWNSFTPDPDHAGPYLRLFPRNANFTPHHFCFGGCPYR